MPCSPERPEPEPQTPPDRHLRSVWLQAPPAERNGRRRSPTSRADLRDSPQASALELAPALLVVRQSSRDTRTTALGLERLRWTPPGMPCVCYRTGILAPAPTAADCAASRVPVKVRSAGAGDLLVRNSARLGVLASVCSAGRAEQGMRRSLRSAGSARRFRAPRRSTASTSTCEPVRCMPWSARTAAASRR